MFPEATRRRRRFCNLNRDVLWELKEAFDMFDDDRSGSIDPKELKATMQALQQY